MIGNDYCVLVLGGYVNGLSIIHELCEYQSEPIYLADRLLSHASFSNKIKKFFKYTSTEDLNLYIKSLSENYMNVYVFVSNDYAIEELLQIKEHLNKNVILPFNVDTIEQSMKKDVQYKLCKNIGVPYPKTIYLRSTNDIKILFNLCLPAIIKPEKKIKNVFRTLVIKKEQDIKKYIPKLEENIVAGASMMVSEVITGNDDNIYAYSCYKNKRGLIIDEWVGRKISQFPNNFGVFSIAKNDFNEVVCEQGRKLALSTKDYGYIEPEFKYDLKDKKFKLMEINYRPMMWHSLGHLAGHSLNYAHISGSQAKRELNIKNKLFLVYLKYEFIKLLRFKSGIPSLIRNFKFGDKLSFVNLKLNDPVPFIIDPFILLYNKALTFLKKN